MTAHEAYPLPVLPEPDFSCGDCTNGEVAYTAAQMRGYALSAVASAPQSLRHEIERLRSYILKECVMCGGDSDACKRSIAEEFCPKSSVLGCHVNTPCVGPSPEAGPLGECFDGSMIYGYTEEQMTAYAMQEVAAERNRCVRAAKACCGDEIITNHIVEAIENGEQWRLKEDFWIGDHEA